MLFLKTFLHSFFLLSLVSSYVRLFSRILSHLLSPFLKLMPLYRQQIRCSYLNWLHFRQASTPLLLQILSSFKNMHLHTKLMAELYNPSTSQVDDLPFCVESLYHKLARLKAVIPRPLTIMKFSVNLKYEPSLQLAYRPIVLVAPFVHPCPSRAFS